jgi:hypothetical protein
MGDEGNLPNWFINEYTFYILLFSTCIFLYKFLIRQIKKYFIWKNEKILNKDLEYSSFSRNDVERATRYYIPTKYQNVSPSEDEEPGSKYIASAKNKLIPLFLKDVFSFKKDDNKYFLILADAGMGKTTFMINLYLAYINQKNKFWKIPKNKIRLYPLGDIRTLNKIKNIKNKQNTILLLDAFDEDTEAIKDYNVRMSKILEVVNEFSEVIITSRTQFFPSEIEEPHTTGYITFGDSNTRRNFQKLYLSVFSNVDIKNYLHKRIPFYNIRKFRRALKITKKSPSLVVRPMLLSHIEDLVNSKESYYYTYQIYQTLIERWVEREAMKPGIKVKHGKENYERLLKGFSQELAVDMYFNKEKRGGYYITSQEQFGENIELNQELIDNLDLSETERRSRSLLNRDAEGKYKFSHKSIMEYFLAKRIVEDKSFAKEFNFQGNDAAQLFYKEMLINEILLPVTERFMAIIDKKGDKKINISSLRIKEKKEIIRLSILYEKKYSKITNKIYKNGVEFKSGINRFDFLYKIFLYNQIVNYLSEEIKLSSIKDSDLLFKIEDGQLKDLENSIRNLKRFYIKTRRIQKTINVNDYTNLRLNKKREVDRFILSANEIIAVLELYTLLFIIDNKSKLFMLNQRNLLKMHKNSTDDKIKLIIEHLIGLTYNIYSRKPNDLFFLEKKLNFRMEILYMSYIFTDKIFKLAHRYRKNKRDSNYTRSL